MTILSPILVIGCHGFYELNEDKTEIPPFQLPFDIIKINTAPLGCSSYIRGNDIENVTPFSITNKNNNFKNDDDIINFIQKKITMLPLIKDNNFEKRIIFKNGLLNENYENISEAKSGDFFPNKIFQYISSDLMHHALPHSSPNIHHDSLVLYKPNDSGGFNITTLFDVSLRNKTIEKTLEEVLNEINKIVVPESLIIIDFSCFNIEDYSERLQRRIDRIKRKKINGIHYGGKKKRIRKSKKKG